DRREQFTLIVREYRHLQMVKRAGRASDPVGVLKPGSAKMVYGIEATRPGECAIDCRACPHPDKNLEEGWQNLPPE
ncbi:hypothetical protein B0H15DRAFT_737613, partial [Mycena belliarum]